MTTTVFFPAGAPNQSASGTLQSVNDAVQLATDSLGSVDFALAGTPVGATVAFEGTSDGTTWYAMKAYPKVPGSAGSTTANAAGSYNVTVGGAAKVRARLTAITSGSFTCVANGTAGAGHVGVKNGAAADLQTTPVPASITPTDRSGSITTGGTAQALMAANANRRGWSIQNNSSGDLWLNEIGGTAVIGQPSLQLPAGALYESPASYCSPSAISIIGATTGQTFTAREA
ncbi:hypothetical protein [Cupriavidus sp. D39]|uniref:hypothetical protein n=1 Tax=Cupriavidus sp. D39 TaxID=2997877 RepID=UPI00226E6CAD|nr:hypothetical protein [Cupriavidus sp. D39]MCY0854355.1 hypothetical protein [Cupriavidus sp. D39]